MGERSGRGNSNTKLLQELESLSQSMHQSHTPRRHASLILPRSSTPGADAVPAVHADDPQPTHQSRSRRLSMSPWRSRPSHQQEPDDDVTDAHRHHPPSKKQQPSTAAVASSGEKKGIWSWKPMRALSHIGMQRLGCLFSVEVVAVQGLPPSMNGLRLCVAVRKKETKDGAVQTMPARVLQGAADFEETLFIRCHVYCSGGIGTGKPLKLESRPFLISVIAIDAPELDFGRSTVDLSQLVWESMEQSVEGARVRQWDASFDLAGKAKGGELLLKLGFQIMEDAGIGIYNQVEGSRTSGSARKQSKFSFSIASPKITRPEPSSTPLKDASVLDLKAIDDFNLDEPGPPPSSSQPIQNSEKEESTLEDLDLPEFEVVDKGIEVQDERKVEEEAQEPEESPSESSVTSEVVKEVVQDSGHLVRLTELDEIAKQITALESMIGEEGEGADHPPKTSHEDEMQHLDAEEETVTREFLQMLELEDEKEARFNPSNLVASPKPGAEVLDSETKVFLPDLGKGLGSVVQTRDGGYLASMNPFDMEVTRKQTPKLVMQISKPFIIRDQKLGSGFDVFQRLAAIGSEELGSKLLLLASMDELSGKTAEQIAFEGMASAIISGRNKEGASSRAAKSVAILKTMSSALSEGRKERIATGIWNLKEEPVPAEEILALAMQKIEAMAVDALKIQAEVANEEAPFDISSLTGKDAVSNPLDCIALPDDDWAKACEGAPSVTLLVVVQLRDPLRRYEAVGGPAIALVQAAREGGDAEGEGRFKVGSLHVGGVKLKSGARRSVWDGERQRLTAMQWLVAYGLAKGGRKGRSAAAAAAAAAGKGGQDLVWSLSSRVMADMWLKPMRNPDVKMPEK